MWIKIKNEKNWKINKYEAWKMIITNKEGKKIEKLRKLNEKTEKIKIFKIKIIDAKEKN